MKEKLEQIRREALAALSETKTAQDLDALRVKYLGKKGALTAVLKQMGGLSAEERPIIGQLANEVREALTTALEQEQKRIEKAALDARLELEQVYDRSSPCGTACFRNLVSLDTVYTSGVCEEHHVVMGCRHQKFFDVIVIDRLHSLDSLTTTVLCAEIVKAHALDVT